MIAVMASGAAMLAVPSALGAADGWHASLDAGLDAAKKSGRPVLAVTIWKQGVCASCDAWRDRVRPDADFRRQLQRFEAVEWQYDGLAGKVVKWTLANGGKSTDPAAQIFVVGADGKVAARIDDTKVSTPAAVAAWMRDQADAWERDHPRTAVPFARANVVLEAAAGAGIATGPAGAPSARCPALAEARESKRAALLYFGRDGEPSDKALKAEASAARRLERTLLDSRLVADAAAGVLLLRFDLGDDAHRAFAASLGVDRAPALLLWEPGAEKPSRIAPAATAPDLVFKLKKLAPPKPDDPPKDEKQK